MLGKIIATLAELGFTATQILPVEAVIIADIQAGKSAAAIVKDVLITLLAKPQS